MPSPRPRIVLAARETDLATIEAICAHERCSRSEAIRRAIRFYLQAARAEELFCRRAKESLGP